MSNEADFKIIQLEGELKNANNLITMYELEIARLKEALDEAKTALVKAVNASQPQTVNNYYGKKVKKPGRTYEEIMGRPPLPVESQMMSDAMISSMMEEVGSYVEVERTPKPGLMERLAKSKEELENAAEGHLLSYNGRPVKLVADHKTYMERTNEFKRGDYLTFIFKMLDDYSNKTIFEVGQSNSIFPVYNPEKDGK